MLADDRKHSLRFAPAGALLAEGIVCVAAFLREVSMDVDGVGFSTASAGSGGREGDTGAARVPVRCKDGGKEVIERRDDATVGTKVHGEPERRERKMSGGSLQAVALCFCEELNLSLPEEIDGLHGVADGKAGATIAGRPIAHQQAEQLMLGARGVLELVNQQVANPLAAKASRFGVAQGSARSQADLGEVDLASLCEDDAQLGHGAQQHGEDVA